MFILLTCGYHYVHLAGIKIDRPEGAGNYAFVFFKTPSRTLLGNKMLPVPPNSYVLYKPDTPQFYCHEESPFVNDWFHCEGEGMREFIERLDFPTDAIIPAQDPHMISNSIRELGSVFRQGGEYAAEIIDADLRSLLLKLRAAYDPSGADLSYQRYYRQFARLRDDIFSSPSDNRTIDAMAAGLNLSRSYFQHIYKEVFGVSVKNDIISSRIEYAKYHLRTGQYSVAEVARLCGYDNNVHFIRQFK